MDPNFRFSQFSHPRLVREARTIHAMFLLYCARQHGAGIDLCPSCAEVYQYAIARLERCPFQENKPTCAKCVVHCYRPDMREKVKEVMRTTGPRMLFKHPILAVRHLLDGYRKSPIIRKQK